MPVETNYAHFRDHLASALNQNVNGKDVALVPASELSGWNETAHLMRSPRNAARLLRALRRGERRQPRPEPVEKPRHERKLGAED